MKRFLCAFISIIFIYCFLPYSCFATDTDNTNVLLKPGSYIVGVDIPEGNYIVTANRDNSNDTTLSSLTITSFSGSNPGGSYFFKSPSDYKTVSLDNEARMFIRGLPLVLTPGTEEDYRSILIEAEARRELTDDEKALAMVIKNVPQVINVAVASEENDPWNGLHKPGNYQALVFFTLTYADSGLFGPAIVGEGIRAGGCVELYEDAQHAEQRNNYLSAFDGQLGLMNPGSHTIHGPVVIRTSPSLTATQQAEVEDSVIAKLDEYYAGSLSIDLEDYINVVFSPAETKPALAPELTSQHESALGSTASVELFIGDQWIVDGQWMLSITGITETDDRNSYSDKSPAAVYIIDYVYQNLGYSTNYSDGLYWGVGTIDTTIVDGAGRMGYSYPNMVTRFPQEAPFGAICNAQSCIGVDNKGPLRINLSKYDGKGINQKATFYIDEADITVKTAAPIPEPTPITIPTITPEPTSTPIPRATPVPTLKPTPAPTPEPTPEISFDHKEVLGDKARYSYDRFEKEWEYYEVYTEKFKDATFYIGLKIFSSDKGRHLDETMLYVKLYDINGTALDTPTSISFLIDDDVYSYKTMAKQNAESSSVALGENGNLLIEALAFCDANDVAVRIGTEKDTYTFDLDAIELTKTLKEFCRLYLKENIWSYCDNTDSIAALEEKYPLYFNGDLADYNTMKKERDLSRIDETFTIVIPEQTPIPTSIPIPLTTPTPKPITTPKPTSTPKPTPKESYLFDVANTKTNMRVGEVNKEGSFYIGLAAVRTLNYVQTAISWNTAEIPSNQEVVYVLFDVYNDSGKIKSYSGIDISVYADSSMAADPDIYTLVGIDGYQAYNSKDLDPGMRSLLVDAFIVDKGWNELTIFAGNLSWSVKPSDILATPYVYSSLFNIQLPDSGTPKGVTIYSDKYDVTYDDFCVYTHNNSITGPEYYAVFEFTVKNTSDKPLDYDDAGHNMRGYQDFRLLEDATYFMDDNINGYTNIYDIKEIKPGMSAKVYVAFEISDVSGFFTCTYDPGFWFNNVLGTVNATTYS